MHDLFTNHRLFRGLPPYVKEIVYGKGAVVEIGGGEVLIEEGAPNSGLFLVLDGRLKVTRGDRTGGSEALILGFRGPGDLLGDYSFIDGLPASATVTTDELTLLYRLGHGALREVMTSDPFISSVIYRNMLEYLIERLREVDAELDRFYL